MTHQVVLPELGENIETADVSAVLVSVGDTIRRDQPLIEVETEKASLEVPAPNDGRVVEVNVAAGDTIKVGQTILVLDSAGSQAEAAAPEAQPEPSPEPQPEPAPEPSPEPAPDDSAVVEFRSTAPAAPPEIGPTVPAAPSVRALARELGIDVNQVPGSGRAGRITRDDVKAYAKSLIASGGSPATGAAPASRPLPDFARWGKVRREPLSRIRRATAANLASAWVTVPHVTQFDRADITSFEAFRKDYNRRNADGTKLTVTAVILKMVAGALAKFPKFNASLDLDAGEVVLKEYIHVGVAVDTEHGLLVPVLRDVDSKPLLQVVRELGELAARARDRKLTPDEMNGACFTISNLGGLGTTYFSPIVNWPQVAILGVGRAETQAVYQDGSFRPHLMLPLSISYDHRLVDGADAARFLRWTAEALEQPLLLLLEDTGERSR